MREPDLLLHELRVDAGEALLLPVDWARVRAAGFLDLREPFTVGPARSVSIEDFLTAEEEEGPATRLIFHVGFCGSTLLSRLLDVPGKCLVLREPHCLSNLVNQHVSRDALRKLVPAVCRHLSRSRSSGEQTVVKPSNWANALLPELVVQVQPRALFMVSSRRSFLLSVLRGGPDRVAFAARAAAHLAGAESELATIVGKAMAEDGNTEAQLARLIIAAYEVQVCRFRAAGEMLNADQRAFITAGPLERETARVVRRAADILDLGLSDAEIAGNIRRWSNSHAKEPTTDFSLAKQSDESSAVELRYGELISKVLAWAERELGPEPTEQQFEASR
jgi:hypothetical protein